MKQKKSPCDPLASDTPDRNISAILPVYNEEGAIEDTLRRLQRILESCTESYEILIVDDGSTDATGAILDAVSLPCCRVIHNPVNTGYGYSIKKGFRAARHPWILLIDGDGSYPAEAIPGIIAELPHSDMVVGARPGGGAGPSLGRRAGKWMIRALAHRLVRHPIPDLNSGLRIIRKELLEKFFRMLPDGFSLTSTITLALLMNAYRVAYVPIPYHPRVGVSKIRPLRDTVLFLHLIVRTVVHFDPLKFFLPLCLAAGASAVTLTLYDIIHLNDITEKTVIVWVAFLLTGAIGVLADLIDRRG